MVQRWCSGSGLRSRVPTKRCVPWALERRVELLADHGVAAGARTAVGRNGIDILHVRRAPCRPCTEELVRHLTEAHEKLSVTVPRRPAARGAEKAHRGRVP
eukprot:scaffold735_cov376-Prasinococcus_capsulatus_cf.AAC.14